MTVSPGHYLSEALYHVARKVERAAGVTLNAGGKREFRDRFSAGSREGCLGYATDYGFWRPAAGAGFRARMQSSGKRGQ